VVKPSSVAGGVTSPGDTADGLVSVDMPVLEISCTSAQESPPTDNVQHATKIIPDIQLFTGMFIDGSHLTG
jgi:hypothetical protein